MPSGAGFERVVQQDFSGGMFSSLAPELIPPNGAFDITNGLLNEEAVCYRRGGTSFFSTSDLAGAPRMLWSGFLKHGGLQTLVAGASTVWKVEADGSLKGIAGLVPPSVLMVPTVFQGVLYYEDQSFDGETVFSAASPKYKAVAANRILAGEGSRVAASSIPGEEGGSFSFEATNYFSFPEGVEITGMVGWRTSVVVFTTRGIWLLGGLTHAAITDEAGNVQWSQDLYSADAVLWGESGVAAWKGGLVIPCKDDVWLMELGVTSEKAAAFTRISGPIEKQYRSYVAAGYRPGAATVFNGHFFLPVLTAEGGTVIDLLVCRLEGAGKAAPAWTRLSGYGAQVAALTSTATDLEGPLIGVASPAGRVLKLGYFNPSAAVSTDANGAEIAFSLTTRSIMTGSLVPNTVAKARLSYRLVGAPGVKVRMSLGNTPYGTEWGAFLWGQANWAESTGPFTDLGEASPPALADPEAVVPKVWPVRRKVRFARVRVTVDGSASQFSIRALELFVRQDGRVI